MLDKNNYRRSIYLQSDKLEFLKFSPQMFARIAKIPIKYKRGGFQFSDFWAGSFKLPKNRCLEEYITWIFDACEIEISNLICPEGFFRNSNETMTIVGRWEMLSWRIRVARNKGRRASELVKDVIFDFDPKEAIEKAKQFYDSYLEQIEKNDIKTASHYMVFEKQKETVIKMISDKYHKTGKDNILVELGEFEDPRSINFVELLLILEKHGYLKITYFKDDYKTAYISLSTKMIDELESPVEKIIKAKEPSQEVPAPKILNLAKSDWYFELRYPEGMELVLTTNILDKNNLNSYILGRPRMGSPANEFFDYLEINYFEKGINKGTVKIGLNSELNLGVDIDTLLSNYGLKGYLKKIFFKISTRNNKDLCIIDFDNCVTKSNLLPNHVEEIKKQVSKLKELDTY